MAVADAAAVMEEGEGEQEAYPPEWRDAKLQVRVCV